MLIPQGLAAPVTEAARRRLAKLEAQREKERAERKAAAEALAVKLAGLSITVSARKKEDSDELYGSVNTKDLIAAVEADRGIKIERSQLNLPDQLKKIGTYDAKIDLGEGVSVPFKVFINEEQS
jgi:large subunit ribosomal protein L9